MGIIKLPTSPAKSLSSCGPKPFFANGFSTHRYQYKAYPGAQMARKGKVERKGRLDSPRVKWYMSTKTKGTDSKKE